MFRSLSFFKKGFYMTVFLSSTACHLLQQSSTEDFYSHDASSLTSFEESGRKVSPLDKRNTRAITLDNKLEVLLISNKDYNKSSAALDVGVGSLEDPAESPGMAHFLEHMLFLGTKKYPAVDDYSEYLAANQGMSNAYTDSENTNYFFEVNTDAFEGALDRFAQFFIEPLFHDDYVEREMNAVDSEHQKNIKTDNWRKHRIANLQLSPSHPQRNFATGNLKTLKKIKKADLLKFYKKHYSANRMKLVMMSSLPLDEMAKMAKEKFSSVKNTNRRTYQYPEKLYESQQLPKEVSIKSIKDLRELDLTFATPSNGPYWRSKPTHLITFLIGHESEGSLLSLLKKEGLATGLSAWFSARSYAGQFHFKISLTEKGLRHKDKVTAYFFSYVKLLKSKTLPMYVYNEIKKMSDIEYVYKDHMEGGNVASYYASKMHTHPALEVEQETELFMTYNDDHYHRFLSYIKPSRLVSFLSTNSVKTNKTEEYYGAEYAVTKISSDRTSLWDQAGLKKNMTLPEKNQYLPEALALLKQGPQKDPRQLLGEPEGVLWFQEDNVLKQPKGRISLLLQNPLLSQNPENKVKSILYQRAIEESFNEWRYQINLAGLDFNVASTARGLQLNFEGYSDHLPKLMKQVATKLKTITISEDEFLNIKKDFIRGIENLQHEAAYQKVLYELNHLSKPDNFHYESYYCKAKGIDLITPNTLKEIRAFSEEIFATFSIEGVAYGNLVESEVKQATTFYFDHHKPLKLPASKRQKDSSFVLKDGENLSLILENQESSPNHSWVKYMQIGKRDMKKNAILRIANSILQPDFYHELRTKKQLGYIVHGGLRFLEKALGLIFIVQSPNHDPFAIEEHYQIWQTAVLEKLKRISAFELEGLKNAVSMSLREEDLTISEKYETLHFETLIAEGEFGFKGKLADVTETVTKEEILAFFEESLNKEKMKTITIYLDKENPEETRKKVSGSSTLITDKASFKQSRPVF